MAGVKPGGYYDKRYRAALEKYWWPNVLIGEVTPPADPRPIPPGITYEGRVTRRIPALFPQVAWWPSITFTPPPPPDDRLPPPGITYEGQVTRRLPKLFPQVAWWPNTGLVAPAQAEPPTDPRPIPAGQLSLFPDRAWPRRRLPTAVYTQLIQLQTPRTAPVTPEAPATTHNLPLMGVGR